MHFSSKFTRKSVCIPEVYKDRSPQRLANLVAPTSDDLEFWLYWTSCFKYSWRILKCSFPSLKWHFIHLTENLFSTKNTNKTTCNWLCSVKKVTPIPHVIQGTWQTFETLQHWECNWGGIINTRVIDQSHTLPLLKWCSPNKSEIYNTQLKKQVKRRRNSAIQLNLYLIDEASLVWGPRAEEENAVHTIPPWSGWGRSCQLSGTWVSHLWDEVVGLTQWFCNTAGHETRPREINTRAHTHIPTPYHKWLDQTQVDEGSKQKAVFLTTCGRGRNGL